MAAGFIINTGQLPGLKLEELRGTALVLSLPAVFEPVLPEVISQEPHYMNTTTLDLMHCLSVARWSTEKYEFKILLNALYDTVTSDARYEHEFHLDPATPIPIVMLAGDSVAIGGFYVDDDWLCVLQGQGAGAGSNWRPFLHYDEIDIAQASVEAKKHGLFPWEGKFWHGLIGLPVINLRPPLSHPQAEFAERTHAG
ncbi:hypothetical protein H0A66_10460 [Alcaligenaceae bacterium]|nr:hypothetical protein [Alcaligenaceae bacterium]